MFLQLEFCGEVNCEETGVMGLSYCENRMIVAWVLIKHMFTRTTSRDGCCCVATVLSGGTVRMCSSLQVG